eukprot:Protomagalhaensia_sp_Gyna_25__1563@NODE_1803_length_1524_cov_194_569697_g1480_i0_p1_GENE_NODE_1803_length_1524_cov_194_569697_g1480_i0NODE_1803_length_1524_cov_194_569697_g1480_i0_p1_ORF_typecomplete_len330_score45_24VRR_NUC/PF08774_11/5e15_NODE_1803_length_1524_cov_194_569697_g1480_i0138992
MAGCKWARASPSPTQDQLNPFQPLQFDRIFNVQEIKASPVGTPVAPMSSLRKTPTTKWQSPAFSDTFSHWMRSQWKHATQTAHGGADAVLGYIRPIKYLPEDWKDKATGSKPVDMRAHERRLKSGRLYGLQLAWSCLGLVGTAVAAVAFQLMADWPYWHSGLPDLHLWKPVVIRDEDLLIDSPPLSRELRILAWAYINFEVEGETVGSLVNYASLVEVPPLPSPCEAELISVASAVSLLNSHMADTRLVEVKGPNDSLSEKQRLWLDVLQTSGELCWVQPGVAT